MPGLDGTGPRGIGPMTGGGRGFCSSSGARAIQGDISIFTPGTYPYYNSRRMDKLYYESTLNIRKELDSLKEQAKSCRSKIEQIETIIREIELGGKKDETSNFSHQTHSGCRS